MELKFIRIAHESGLGKGRLDEIEIMGRRYIQENWGFTVGNNTASAVGNFIWFGPLKPLQKLFFRTPLVYMSSYSGLFSTTISYTGP